MRKHRFGGDKLRRAIAVEAARIKYEGRESEYFHAKRKAAKRFGVNHKYPYNLPSNGEIKEELLRFADMFEGEDRLLRLGDMRLQALKLMRLLKRFHPKLIGSVLKGTIRKGSDIDIHVFTDSVHAVATLLAEEQIFCQIDRKTVIDKDGKGREFVHLRGEIDDFPIELTVYSSQLKNFRFMSSVTNSPIETAKISEVEDLLAAEHPDLVGK
ncbi:MAG: nucleotidyltransferase domain-containing protein [Acidiferrobacterales bacterium]|nr:nucleotidyltransferase domain-containing protein [Acidiferrobacterales bacterium]